MTGITPKPKRPIRSWWFTDVWSPDGRLNGFSAAMLVLVAMCVLPFVIILLTNDSPFRSSLTPSLAP